MEIILKVKLAKLKEKFITSLLSMMEKVRRSPVVDALRLSLKIL
jgi:hypothetical protein